MSIPLYAPVVATPTNPLYWSIRRELWENRSIYLAPLTVAVVFLFGFVLGMATLPQRMKIAFELGKAGQTAFIAEPYSFITIMLMNTSLFVGIFYCLDALNGERRDRSILFWKSLPVSDRVSVLSKFAIPFVILPALIFVIIIATDVVMLLLSSVVLITDTHAVATLWARLPLFSLAPKLLYTMAAIALWHAPIYGWMLLVSSIARRATFLWAMLPVFVIFAFETIAFRSSVFVRFLAYRMFGWLNRAFVPQARPGFPTFDPLTLIDPVRFLTTPGLWTGLIVTAILLVVIVQLRRDRGAL